MTRTSEPDFEFGTLNPYLVRDNEIRDGDHYGYKVVAVVHMDGRAWTAYRGPTAWTDLEVARQGDVIPHDAAKALFPTLDASIGTPAR